MQLIRIINNYKFKYIKYIYKYINVKHTHTITVAFTLAGKEAALVSQRACLQKEHANTAV